METLVLPPPQDQFACQLEQNRRKSVVPHTTNKPEQQRRGGGAIPTSHKAQVLSGSNPYARNKFKPTNLSYGILPLSGNEFELPLGNNLQIPRGNNLQFRHANSLHFPPGNNLQYCPVNGLQSSSVNGLQQRSGWALTTAAPECETFAKPSLFPFPQPALFPCRNSAASSTPAHPPMSPPFPDFSGCNSVVTSPPGCRWHSMPGVLLSPPPPLISSNEISKGRRSAASLPRSRSLASESSFYCRSPEQRILPERHSQSRSPKHVLHVLQDNGKTTRSNDNRSDDYRARPWQAGQKSDREVADKWSSQNIFEWKSVDMGVQRSQNSGKLGSEKQVFAVPSKVAGEKRNIVKKVSSAMKSGGKSNYIKNNGSSESKVVNIPQCPPKAETAEKNVAETFAEFVYSSPVGHNHNDAGEEGSDGFSTRRGIFVEDSIRSYYDAVSGFPHALDDNFEDHGGCNRCNKGYLENGRTDQQDARHCDCSMADRVPLMSDDRDCRKKELEKDLAISIPILGDGELLTKESSQDSQVGHIVPFKESRTVQSQLKLEGGSKGGLFPTATSTVSFDDIGKAVCSGTPSFSTSENWAGPTYSNSPPPSSLPFPKFSMRQMRSISLELTCVNDDFSEAALPGSQSAPSSPARDVSEFIPPRGKLQGLCLDVVSATKDLRRMLNLDFNA